MLDNVVAGFLDGLNNEREFDAPFFSLLRTLEFYDLHFLHGSFEFGKDFIAKRDDSEGTCQYVFQSKFGDMALAEWNRVQPQCELMLYSDLGHPNLDASLPRKGVVVLTGRLKGAAAEAANQYVESLEERKLPPLEIWDRDTLLESMLAPHCLGRTDWYYLGGVIDQAIRGELSLFEVGDWTVRWISMSGTRGMCQAFLEAALLRSELWARQLHSHAFRLVLGLGRAIYVQRAKGELKQEEADQLCALLKAEVRAHAVPVLSWLESVESTDDKDCLVASGPVGFVTAGARLMSVVEIVATYDLMDGWSDDQGDVVKRVYERFLSVPACGKPVSDNLAVAAITVAVAARRRGVAIERWLTRIIVWVCDAYDDGGVGIGQVGAETQDHLWRVMGARVENDGLEARRESWLAAAVLDTLSILGLEELYEDAANDFAAVKVLPVRLVPEKSPEDAIRGERGCVTAYAGDYSLTWKGEDGWRNSEIHAIADKPRWFDSENIGWLGVVLGLVMRDRWWLHSLRSIDHTLGS